MKRAFVRVFLVALALHLVGLGAAPLLEPDEGRYGDIAREMTHATPGAASSWLLPRACGLPFLDKPPLVAWLGALSLEAFGPSELALRAIPAAAALLSVAVAAWLASQAYGRPRAAAWAALACATAPLALGVGRIFILDAPLAALMSLGLALVLRGAGALRAPPSHGIAALGGVAVGLATLVKGPVAFGLVGLGNAVALAVNRRDPAVRLRTLSPVPWLAATAVAAPWYFALHRVEPDFFEVFILKENLQRFGGVAVEHKHGPLFFLATTAWGLGPWTLVAASLLWAAWTARTRGEPSPARDLAERRSRAALLGYAAIVVAFFSASSTKVETYVLPAIPALAAVIGGEVVRALERGPSWRRRELGVAFGAVAAALALACLAGAVFALGVVPIPEKASLARRASAAASPFLALVPLPLVWLAIVAARQQRALEAASRLALALLAAIPYATGALLGASVERSARPVARAILDWRATHGPAAVAVYRYYYRGLPYYLDEPVVLLGEKGELQDEAVRARPGIYFPDVAWSDPARTDRQVFSDFPTLGFLLEARERPLLVVCPLGGGRPVRFLDACARAGVTATARGEHGDDRLYEVGP